MNESGMSETWEAIFALEDELEEAIKILQGVGQIEGKDLRRLRHLVGEAWLHNRQVAHSLSDDDHE